MCAFVMKSPTYCNNACYETVDMLIETVGAAIGRPLFYAESLTSLGQYDKV